MDKLPDEVLEMIVRRYARAKASSSKLEDRIEVRGTLAALARSSKSLCRVTTPLLYDRVHLDSRLRTSRYLRTYTGHLTPWTKRKKRIESHHPRSLSIDLSNGSLHSPMPSLRMMKELGHFSNLRTLEILHFTDPAGNLTEILAPFSPLRSQLTRLVIDDPEVSQATDFVTAFIFELPLYLPDEAFLDDAIRRATEITTVVELEDPGRLDRGISSALRTRCRTDFDTFVSKVDYFFARYFFLVDPVLVETPWSQPSPFSSLTSLECTVGEMFHLSLLLETPTLKNLKSLKLSSNGREIVMLDAVVFILRRSISVTKDSTDEAGSFQSSRNLVYADEYEADNSITPARSFLDDYRYQKWWPPLDPDEVELFGEYSGPKLDRLDIRQLGLYVYGPGW